LAAALATRVALVYGTPEFAPENDAADYDRHAQSLAERNRFPDSSYAAPGSPSALRPPAYPVLLGAVYKAFGSPSWTAGRLVGALLGTLTVLLIYALGRELWGARAGLVGAAFAAVYPPLVMVNGSLLSEAMFLPLMLGVAIVVLWHRRQPDRWSLLVAAGVLCGAAALTRSVGLALLIPALLGAITVASRNRGQRAKAAALVVSTAVLVVAPWSVRNTLSFDRFVPLSTQNGPTIAGAYNSVAGREDEYWGVWRVPFWLPEFRSLVRGTLDEAEIDRDLASAARRYGFDNPGYALRLTGANTLRFFDVGPSHALITRTWYAEMGVPPSLRRWTTLAFYVAVALGALGIGFVFRQRRFPNAPLFLWVFPLVMYLSVIPIHGGMRYRVPIDPFVLLPAGVLAASLPRSRFTPPTT
jgi:4-amino-4-deoxy-L-arabinose transferase-like glycosyltransferase